MRKQIIIVLFVILAVFGAAFYFMKTGQESTRTEPVKIVAFGDSLTAGYDVPTGDNYPSQLRGALARYKIEMVNMGQSGDTTDDAKSRVEQVIDEKPDIVILGIGGNDALRGLPAGTAKKNIEDIIDTLEHSEKPPRIILLNMQAPLTYGLDYKGHFDAIYREVADEYRIPLVPFIITKIYLDTKYVLPDRIHMNREGYAYVVKHYLASAVEGEIKKLK